jgi:hypothetical protein
MDKATPRPWATNDRRVESQHNHGWANDGWIIAQCEGPDAEANAALIVRAVNSFDAMLEALSDLRATSEKMGYFGSTMDKARAALELANQKESK